MLTRDFGRVSTKTFPDINLLHPMNTLYNENPTEYPYIIVTISDSNYVIPTYVLILSLLRNNVRAMVHLLPCLRLFHDDGSTIRQAENDGRYPEQTNLFT